MGKSEPERVHAALAYLQGGAWHDEYVLQDAIERLLVDAGLFHRREVEIGRDRLDFLLEGGTGIEVKVGGATTSLIRQVDRYLAHDMVASVVVVTTRNLHRRAAGILRGKRVRVIWLRCL